MRPARPWFSAALLALYLFASHPAAAAVPELVRPPYTRSEIVRDTLHGTVVEDRFRWLEDKDSPETRAWVRQQMAYTQHLLGQVEGRDGVRQTVARFARVDTRSAPIVRGSRMFYTARSGAQQQSVLVLEQGEVGPTVLVDPNTFDSTFTTSASFLDISADGKLVAYGIRKGGEDEVEVHFFEVDSRQELADQRPKARYFGVSIDQQRRGFYYGRYAAGGSRIFYHVFGQDPAADAVIFGEGLTAGEIPSARLSDDGRWLLIRVSVGSAGDDTRLYLKDVARAGKVVTVADKLKSSLQFDLVGQDLYILTDWKAPNGRLMTTQLGALQPEKWRELVPERKDAVLESFSIVGGKLYLKCNENVATHLYAHRLTGERLAEIALPGPGTASSIGGRSDQAQGYFTFSAFNRPVTILRLDTSTDQSTAWWSSPVAFDPDRYDVRQFKVRSPDGAQVPFYMVSRKGLEFNGSNPTLMSGYGGFQQSQNSQFSSTVATWLELGGVYVSTNLRGGGEFGEEWHRAGMLAQKQHTFDDFLAVAQWLIGRGVCYPNKLAISGGSNGGLLVGAAFTQRPDLFGAVLCSVPLLDMLRYQRFLVARFWVPEYGSSENAEQFQWLKAYSPYHNVKPGVKYPAIMFVSGDSDTRVDPLHARKMAALMQSMGGDQPMLLHYDVTGGHSGGKSVDRSIEDTVDNMQFLRWRLGMLESAP